MSNAFAPIVRARPCPIFGRPVHQGSPPLITARYFSSNPSDSGSLRTPCPPASYPAGRRGITPAFGYSAPHPSAEGTLTLLIHALPSAHYGPVRLPPRPPLLDASRPLPSPATASVPCPLPRRIERVLLSITSPFTRPSPHLAGSASALWISRPAQASLALRPAGSLDRQKRPLSRGSDPSGHPAEPLVSFQINRQLSGWNLSSS